jgi:hypothetical protein
MRRFWRRYWPVCAALAAIAAVVVVHVVVNRLTREGPNYSLIEDGFYLGGRVAEPPPGTRAVLNLCELEDAYRTENHRWQPINDGEPAPSLDWLREQVEFVDAQRRAVVPLYVHCQAGVSRGGMVVTAYFMAHNGWSRDQALAFVRTRRAIVNPNPAFMQLLLEWEKTIMTP